MLVHFHLDRICRGAVLVTLLAALSACGSSATTTTAPSTITRCAVSIQTETRDIPAQGGTGVITVTTTRECTWTAATEGQWLTIRGEGNGQGDGTVEFSAAANADPAVRRGAILLNNQRAEVVQAAAECEISLSASAATFGRAGGSGEFSVRASSGMCSWTASTDADWIVLRTQAGQGNAPVRFDVQPSTGTSRSALISVAGQRFSVTQAEGCAYAISPPSASLQPAGGSGAVTVTTGAGCPWTASSNAPWLSVSPATGSGPGAVTFSAASTSGPARTGTAVIAGHTFTLLQSDGCAYDVRPSSESVEASGGSFSVTVRSAAGCSWSASSEASWISIRGASSGSGNGSVTFVAGATSGPARTGRVTVAGTRVTVSQAAGCTVSISPQSASVDADGGQGTVRVSTADGCRWTAASNASWLTIASGASGEGGGEVRYSVARSTGAARSGVLTIGGQTFTVTQGEACSYALSSSGASIAASGGQGTFDVATGSSCGWQAASSVPWITIDPAGIVTGSRTVRFTVAANPDAAPRSGTITAAGGTFTVQQAGAVVCTYALTPDSFTAPPSGGSATVQIAAPAGCAWTASSSVDWLSIPPGTAGSGDGTVRVDVAANTGAARTGTVTIAGRPFTVTQQQQQQSSCTYALSDRSLSVSAAGGHQTVDVSAQSGCAWTAESQVSWILIIGGTSSGQGSGEVRMNVQRNSTGAPRAGTVVIAGQTLTVNQDQ